jgi:hypothetical protein
LTDGDGVNNINDFIDSVTIYNAGVKQWYIY